MKFQVVGAGGEDSGCSYGDATVVTNPSQPVVYYLSELVASAAEGWLELPTVAGGANVTAAGSVEYNTFGGYGNGGVVPNTNMDPAYQAGIITLRNSSAVEQKQIERRWPPGLDAEGCNPNRGFPECWIWSYDRMVSGNLLQGALDPQTGELTASVLTVPAALTITSTAILPALLFQGVFRPIMLVRSASTVIRSLWPSVKFRKEEF